MWAPSSVIGHDAFGCIGNDISISSLPYQKVFLPRQWERHDKNHGFTANKK